MSINTKIFKQILAKNLALYTHRKIRREGNFLNLINGISRNLLLMSYLYPLLPLLFSIILEFPLLSYQEELSFYKGSPVPNTLWSFWSQRDRVLPRLWGPPLSPPNLHRRGSAIYSQSCCRCSSLLDSGMAVIHWAVKYGCIPYLEIMWFWLIYNGFGTSHYLWLTFVNTFSVNVITTLQSKREVNNFLYFSLSLLWIFVWMLCVCVCTCVHVLSWQKCFQWCASSGNICILSYVILS